MPNENPTSDADSGKLDAEQVNPQAALDAAQDALGDDTEDKGKGSKSAVLADLAGERDKRQAAEKAQADTQSKLDAVLAALGIGDPEDPAKAAEQYKSQAEIAEQKLAVITAAPDGVDAAALLDSQSFMASLDGVDNLADHIAKYAEDNPRFKLAPAGTAGARDAAQRGTPAAPTRSMDDWIRGRR